MIGSFGRNGGPGWGWAWRSAIAAGLVASALAVEDATADKMRGALEEAREAVEVMRDAGAFNTRSDAEILGDLEEKGYFSGRKGDAIREDIERFVRQIRFTKPVEPKRFGHANPALVTPESEPNDSIATANATSCGASICASIQVAGDQDYYTYTIASTQFVTHETICDGDTTLTLYDSGNNQIGFDDDGGSLLCSLLTVTLSAGTYTIRVGEFLDNGTVNYTLNITCSTPPPSETEPNDTLGQANSLPCGTALQAAVNPIGDIDWFQVVVPARSTLTVRTFNCAGDTTMFLRDAAGTEIEFDDDDGDGLCSLITRDVFAGTYYVEIHEFGDNGTVSYFVDATCTPLPTDEVEPNDNAGTANPIACGETKRGTHSPNSDVDFWVFSLAADATVIATANCDGDSVLRLFNSSVTQIAIDNDSGPGLCSQIVQDLVAGTYYLAVNENGQDAIFSYDLSVVCAERIVCDTMRSGSIAVPGEIDSFALTLGTDQLVTLDVACDGDAEMTVTDSGGNVVGFSDDAVGTCPRLRLNLPAGTYSIAINEDLNDGTVNYTLVVTCEDPLQFESEPNDDPSLANPTACGQATSGAVNPAGDLDFWSFTVASRSQLVAETDCDGDTTLTLLDASLTQIGFDDDGGANLCSRLVASVDPGNYFILVRHFVSTGTVNYILDLTCQALPTVDEVEPNNDFLSANQIACGQGLRGVIDPSSDADWWTFTLGSTMRVNVAVNTISSDLDSAMSLYAFNQSGNLVKIRQADNTFDFDPAMQITLGPGPYYLEVVGLANTGAFSLYTVSVSCSAPNFDNRGCIDNGHTLNGTIGVSGENDVYTFAGQTGDRVRVILKSGAFDPNVLILRPDGQLVDYDDDDADLTGAQACIALPVDGDYQIIVGDLATGTGAYSISLDLDSALTGSESEPNNTRAQSNPLSHGAHVSGTRSTSTDNDLYRFSGAVNDTVTVDVRTCVGNDNTPNAPTNLTLELYNSAGTLLVSSLDDGEDADPLVTFVLPGSAGDYFIGVTGPTAGDYELFFDFNQVPYTFSPLAPCVVSSGTVMQARVSAINPSSIRKSLTFTVDRIPEGGAPTRIRTRNANAPAGLNKTVTVSLGPAPAVGSPTRFRYLANVTVGATSYPVDFEVLVTP